MSASSATLVSNSNNNIVSKNNICFHCEGAFLSGETIVKVQYGSGQKSLHVRCVGPAKEALKTMVSALGMQSNASKVKKAHKPNESAKNDTRTLKIVVTCWALLAAIYFLMNNSGGQSADSFYPS